VVMGVSGVGKTTVGQALAERLGWEFVDGDDLHPASNVAKMARGEPLDDADRRPWLVDLHDVVDAHRSARAPLVMACSALKVHYRKVLAGEQPGIVFVHLRGDPALIAPRTARRRGHFMPAALLESQLEDLEAPSDAIEVPVNQPVDAIVQWIIDAMDGPPPPPE
jgi:gluconokinase